MIKRVKSDGPLSARIVVIGEAPGREENKIGRPFVGQSGRLWMEWLTEVGLRRRDIYVMNVCEYMAPHSKIENLPRDEVEAWADSLHTRLLACTDPYVLVPMGNIALRALLRQPLWSNRSAKITDHRGSIYRYDFDDGRWCKVIPSIHPAAALRETGLSKLCRADWRRIMGDAQFRARRLPRREHYIAPNIRTADYLAMSLDACHTVMAIDIETPRRRTNGPRHIECVGFSYDPSESLTLRYPEDKAAIKHLCESPCRKVGQNFLFDRYWLKREAGIDVLGEIDDLIGMHHALDAAFPGHSLATMASVDTREPYWKKSAGKDAETTGVDKTPREKLMAYCGKDACVTRELFDVYDSRLLR